MRPETKSSDFLLSGRILSNVIAVPPKREIMLQRVDQEIEKLCQKIPHLPDPCLP